MMEKSPLIGKTVAEISEVCTALGMPAFSARQISDWLYKKGIADIDEMTNISVSNREKLKEKYIVGRVEPVHRQQSVDGTVKYLFSVENGYYVETVYIPEDDRATLCVSSQVGCKMNCLFCMTGKQGYNGNLSYSEILNQILSVPERDKLTNLVFMGMGEPMDNIDNLFRVLEILTSSYGFGWSPKRITVSTIGLIPGLKRFLEESNCHLAVSIHSPFPEERLSIMPVEKAYPILDVLNLVRKYDFSHQRRISFEYIMFKGLNDDIKHAKALSGLLKGFPCRVNLLNFHPVPGVALDGSNPETMIAFRDYLTSNGIICTIRSSRGEDISAACGMLSSRNIKTGS